MDRLIALFTRLLGKDLTIADPTNPFYHNGNAVNLAAGSARDYRPWVWLWEVAFGRSAGNDAAAQSCAAWVQDQLDGHMFKQ